MKSRVTTITTITLIIYLYTYAHATTHRFEPAYVRIDNYTHENLKYIGQLPTSPSPYTLHVYVWDNRTNQYVTRQAYTKDGLTPLTGTTTYPITIPRASSDDGAEIP